MTEKYANLVFDRSIKIRKAVKMKIGGENLGEQEREKGKK